jgi:electron transport complex protein RnfC
MYMGSGALPASLGCIVDNVWTLASIYRAVCENTPLYEKGFTVTGEGAVNPGNFMIRIGTSVSEVLEAAGGMKEETKKALLGGPMMGLAIPNTNVPLMKANNALYLMTEDEVELAEEEQTNCIRCGRCIRSCPMGLAPQQMMLAAKRGDLDRFIALHGLDCIQCGCCTYTCPARQPLVPTFKLFKPRAMAYNRAKQAAEKGGK